MTYGIEDCPFCDDIAFVVITGEGDENGYRVACINTSKCPMQLATRLAKTEYWAIRRWNRAIRNLYKRGLSHAQ